MKSKEPKTVLLSKQVWRKVAERPQNFSVPANTALAGSIMVLQAVGKQTLRQEASMQHTDLTLNYSIADIQSDIRQVQLHLQACSQDF